MVQVRAMRTGRERKVSGPLPRGVGKHLATPGPESLKGPFIDRGHLATIKGLGKFGSSEYHSLPLIGCFDLVQDLDLVSNLLQSLGESCANKPLRRSVHMATQVLPVSDHPNGPPRLGPTVLS